MEANNENEKFRLKAIAELLDGKHEFIIPSYQRGYRWDKNQVEDLLKDIWDFARNDKNKKDDFYCLQPIVVKPNKKNNANSNEWIVIDGQQRLTTLFLLLNFIKKDSRRQFVTQAQMYNISYAMRKEVDFTKLEKASDIDSYHIYQANSIIKKWFSDRIDDIDYSALEKVLFHKSKEVPKINFIWYVAEDEGDVESIKTFNNINKGKIRLTNAELIKALFILKVRQTEENSGFNEKEFSYEWNEIENTLHNDKIWLFLAHKDYKPATRIDIIFDFISNKTEKDDSDYTYRKFQKLFDKDEKGMQFWEKQGVANFTDAWKKVKSVFQTFVYWYEDSTLYHYIGYLVYWKTPLLDIYNKCNEKPKTLIEIEVINMIKEKIFKNVKKEEIDELTYTENKKLCEKLLLFFNIETSVRIQKRLNEEMEKLEKLEDGSSSTYYKFPFDLCKYYDWDIEHVGSQTQNPLTEVKDKIIWLSYIENIDCQDKNWKNLKDESVQLKKILEEKKKDIGNKFDELYKKIIAVVQKDDSKNKVNIFDRDTIGNLALLDAGTNRGYGNALFPTKRQIIIEKDKDGIFIPICTKNLFLKYYSKDEKSSSQWKNTWTSDDAKAYLSEIHKTIDFILN